ncbi:MAG: hypothetical protein WDZ35_08755 [Crocinitomicaceae bacterium]
MDEKIVYAEIESVTDQMRRDKNALIISDTGLFLVCTKLTSKWYNEKFHTVPKEAIKAYQIKRIGNKVFSPLFPSK